MPSIITPSLKTLIALTAPAVPPQPAATNQVCTRAPRAHTLPQTKNTEIGVSKSPKGTQCPSIIARKVSHLHSLISKRRVANRNKCTRLTIPRKISLSTEV